MSKKYTAIGGQALIEGVMMRGSKKIAIAVRKPDGEIEMKEEDIKGVATTKWMKVPFLRGILAMGSSMSVGVRALMYSAEFYAEEEGYEESKFDKWIMEKFGDKAEDIIIGISMVMALVTAVLFFMVLPAFLVNFMKGIITSPGILAIFEGILKFALFIGYVLVIRRMRDIRRVFQYHGAEHKCIHCLESGKELTVENAKTFTTLHPRCGTSFLIIVLSISIIVASFIPWSSVLMRAGIKVMLLPLVAGISYEILKLAGKRSQSKIMQVISWPGLMMQKLTTAEPDDDQLEVALASLKQVLESEEDGFGCSL